MFYLTLSNASGRASHRHDGGPAVIGRAPTPGPGATCYHLDDPFAEPDHLRVEATGSGGVRVENLSRVFAAPLDDGRALRPGESLEVALPVRIALGSTAVALSADAPGAPSLPGAVPAGAGGIAESKAVRAIEGVAADRLARWFETVLSVQRAAASSEDFYHEAARAVVDLVGLDRAVVLVRAEDGWNVAAMHCLSAAAGAAYSSHVVNQVAQHRRTLYQNLVATSSRQSLFNIEAVVAAPVFDAAGNVASVLYGSRNRNLGSPGGTIQSIEAQLVQVLAAAVGAGLSRLRLEATASELRERFERFFTPRLAAELVRDPGLLQGRLREVTVLVGDLRGFTRLSEYLGPEQTFQCMGEALSLQSHCIERYDGVVVDYAGDGILAMWNAPAEQPNHAQRACQAAIAIQQALPDLSRRWCRTLPSPLRLGLGLSTGTALVGNTGSDVKIKYGPMGPVVNTASRVEEATKYVGVPIAITAATRSRLGEDYATRRLGRFRLAGVGEPVELFELHDQMPAVPHWEAERQAFEEALQHYEEGRWADACKALLPMLTREDGAHDAPSLRLLGRATECLQSQPSPFDPVTDLCGRR
ncbi:MAG: adenylate/guanylate cyclase domain-containing protein [Candidatus Schekmanbacteria bacterium]|nr:adenylate/guanylate cyclase domain-containing protein [Candidatus Schekmanbacteria bacterium]